ncbi:hypothetical protein WJX74_010946 [Apatococcus lobatus]|uniref:Uncharacterized protein n=1 Tax=Apatococcus lobatus TaxID=904363 RepID=A0AAW1R501_9CHLO
MANLAKSVHLLDMNLSRKSLDAWKALDDSLCSSTCSQPLHASFNRKVLPVPEDIERSHSHHCMLTLRPFGYHFRNQSLNQLMASLFDQIPLAVRRSGLPEVSLDRFDLFHAHLFIADEIGAGLLFHASEYPALGPTFRYNLGFCQVDSRLQYSEAKMSWRNLVFIKGRLFAIDLTEGSFLFSRILSKDLCPFRTAQDHDFGRVVADVNYFPQLQQSKKPSLYICEY